MQSVTVWARGKDGPTALLHGQMDLKELERLTRDWLNYATGGETKGGVYAYSKDRETRMLALRFDEVLAIT